MNAFRIIIETVRYVSLAIIVVCAFKSWRLYKRMKARNEAEQADTERWNRMTDAATQMMNRIKDRYERYQRAEQKPRRFDA